MSADSYTNCPMCKAKDIKGNLMECVAIYGLYDYTLTKDGKVIQDSIRGQCNNCKKVFKQ